ncbi:NDP-hexose 2,3-dehydratase family protein [Kitasatospora azatica]|uniref:NDP-hexose 2,3-dehydratase family protein n=1 Tax=Kitasatospora azatica TaxID=58347 RepID=UPI0005638451|nr:NDP-hexose 2,3-dehydratase family protein [Kitasatospora azatica]
MTTTLAALRPRHDRGPAARIARSAALAEGAHLSLDGFHHWFAERQAAHRFRVDRIPFADLEGWRFEQGTGNLVHHTGRFFSVEGLRVTTAGGDWCQPIIRQPEIGVLGILVKEFDGVLHCLMQAKMEPGNPTPLQLSPTVQATRSNYTGAHGGAGVRYIEYFTQPGRGEVLADVLQSEHGSWFYRKHNRNMIVQTDEEVPLHPDFCWLTFGQLAELLRLDNLVNMDSRTVLACAPLPEGPAPDLTGVDGFTAALVRSRDAEAGARHTDAELRAWFTGQRTRHHVRAECLPLNELPGWLRTERAIEHPEGRFFDVVAVAAQTDSREVRGWTQPLFAPRGQGVVAFLARPIEGVLHLLVHARMEGGLPDLVELAPTVQYTPQNYRGRATPPFLAQVLDAAPDRIRYQALHSEEGGRFLDAVSRYLVIEADEQTAPLEAPEGYRWLTLAQLAPLIQHGHRVNVQARTLVACLNALAGRAV